MSLPEVRNHVSLVCSLGYGMASELKKQGKKKKNAKQGEKPDGSFRGDLTGDYLVGQVADSLSHSKRLSSSSSDRLAALFSASKCPVHPVYVSAPKETTKKRHREEEELNITAQVQRPRLQEVAKKGKVKKVSDADKRLAHRESALANADLEEEAESHRKLGQKRQSSCSGDGVEAAGGSMLGDPDPMILDQRRKVQNSQEERLKNERTVFVGNLPVMCNKKKLKSLFKEYGQIESVRFRSVIPAEGTSSKKLAAITRKIHPDQKNINAYVVFKDESAARKALQRNGAQIAEGVHLRVDLASETSSRDKRSVFVGNLPYKIEDSAVEQHFLDCGGIVAVRVIRDQLTGVGKGFGYVLFENTDSVHLALRLNNSELMGRKLRVMRAVTKEKLRPQSSNPGVRNSSKPLQGRHFAPKQVEAHPKSGFIGEKAVLTKKKKKGQKKSRRSVKHKKQK
ncbi:RNA-binding protein 34 [Rhynchocyon petersi]